MVRMFFVVMLVVALWFGVTNEQTNTQKTILETENVLENPKLSIHPTKFFEKHSFYSAIEEVKKNDYKFKKNIRGGIVPHHLLPSLYIADFFNRLAKQNPKTIILIGPNHYEKGDGHVLTSQFGWETPFGVVFPNGEIINYLVDSNIAMVDEVVLPDDHAVSGIIPFVKYYLPNTQVVPLLLSGYISDEEIDNLVNSLSNQMGNDVVFVAAVDFSHYLTSKESKEKDEITWGLINNRDYFNLRSLNNSYLDSPASIVVLLKVMDKLDVSNLELLHHTNSGEMVRNESVEVTSYFVAGFSSRNIK